MRTQGRLVGINLRWWPADRKAGKWYPVWVWRPDQPRIVVGKVELPERSGGGFVVW